jgi:WD40 repeat protein
MQDDTETYAASDTGGARPNEARPLAPLQVRDRARYQIIAEHGRGGIGRVLRATDREFGRDVAVKELLIRTSSSEMRFMREALITARLEHPNIVPVHEAGRWDDGTPFYAMKLVAGRPLKALIAEARTYPERLKLLDRVLAVTDAIAYAHDRGVIHRDLKPSNIIVGDYGETIVIDWGLAKTVGETDEGTSGPSPSAMNDLTVAGAVLGTPAYMAPEQAAGAEATARSDVYALGAIVLDVLRDHASGAAPKAASDSDDTSPQGAVGKVDVAIPDAPADLRSIVRRAMAAVPAERYPSARAFGDDLRRFTSGIAVEAHRYTGREWAARWLVSHRRVVAVAVISILLLFIASTVFLARESRLRHTAEDSRSAALNAQHIAERERDRADAQTVALLEAQSRVELDAGHPFRAAPLLAEAYRRSPTSTSVRWMLTESLQSIVSLTSVLNIDDLSDPENLARTVRFSPDDSTIVVGRRKDIRMWDTRTWQPGIQWVTPWVSNQIRYSTDGTRLLNIKHASDGVARILNATTGEDIALVPISTTADYVVWSPDGTRVAAAHPDGRVEVWSATSKKVVVGFMAAPAIFGCLAFNADGSVLAARGVGELVLARDNAIQRIPVPGEDIQVVAFSQDGGRLLTTMSDRSLLLWDVPRATPLYRIGHQSSVPYLAVFSPDGQMVATSDLASIHLWDVESATSITTIDLPTRDLTLMMSFANSSATLATLTNDFIRFWHIPRERWLRSLPRLGTYSAGGFLANGDVITIDSETPPRARIRIWDGRTLLPIRSTDVAWEPSAGFSFTPDGTLAALASSRRVIDLVNTTDGRISFSANTDTDIGNATLSNDGAHLAISTADRSMVIFAVKRQKEVYRRTFKGTHYARSAVMFSPNSQEVALAGGFADFTRIINLNGSLREFRPNVHAVAYSRDGHRLFLGGSGDDTGEGVWDAVSGELITSLDVSSPAIVSALSATGSILATTGDDRNVYLWDAVNGALLRTFPASSHQRLSGARLVTPALSFSPDDRHLLALQGPVALIWNLELDSRSPEEVDALVSTKSQWRLDQGRLRPVVRPH